MTIAQSLNAHHDEARYHCATLSNGLRMVHITTQRPVGWCGVAVNAGSRDDPADRMGLAHFVEHTLFKGTEHRRAWHILNRMERVGGELNAYTTRENTMLYSVYPAQYAARAIELLADIVCHSVFPPDHLERERDVVLEEAAGYRDTPSDAVYDDFEDLLMGGGAMGHNILGTEHDLHQVTRDDCLQYMRDLYVPQNMVFFTTGPEPCERIFKLAERYLGGMPAREPQLHRSEPAMREPVQQTIEMGLHQAHLVTGARVPGKDDDRLPALMLLNNLLGGPGMNSLLNVELRERRGAAYSIESSLSTFTDCGMIEIYVGCDAARLNACRRVIDRVTQQLASSPLTPRRLDEARTQLCGQLTVAADNSEWLLTGASRGLLYDGAVTPLRQTIERIQSVTAEQLRAAAELITAQCRSSLTYL